MLHHICILRERGGERGKKMRGRGGGRGEKTGEGGENMWCTYDDVAINIPRQDVDVIWRDGTALHTTLTRLLWSSSHT